MGAFLKLSRYFERGFDVFGLGGFVAACQQNDDFHAALHEVNPIAWAIVDPHF